MKDCEEIRELYNKIRQGKEADRVEYATNKITTLGYTCRYSTDDKCLLFDYKGAMVRFYPYKGWFTGKTVKDGRGLRNLLKQIKL